MPKKSKYEEVIGTFLGSRYLSDNGDGMFVIGTIGRKDLPAVTVKGLMPYDEQLQKHLRYRFYGRWEIYKKTGDWQLAFKSYVRSAPHGRTGVILYLQQAPGIGKGLATRLWEYYKGDAVRALREEPDLAVDSISGLSLQVAMDAATWLTNEQRLEGSTVDLHNLIGGRGFPRTVFQDAIELWGNAAAQKIKKDPYQLLKIKGCGFGRTHDLYLDLGGDPKAIRSQAMCAWYAIHSRGTGDSWHNPSVAEETLKKSIPKASIKFREALQHAGEEGLLEAIWTDGKRGPPSIDGDTMWLATGNEARAERTIASVVERARQRGTAPWPSVRAGVLSPHQEERLAVATSGHLGLLTGGPGTGKTHTAAQLIKECGETFGYETVFVCGPTGKSAVCLSDAMNSHGIPLTARTIHSTLGGWSFRHHANNRLRCKVLVVDEFSMVSSSLAAALLAATADDCLVLLVGDPGQLLPVGSGAPFRDLLRSNVPCGKLTELHRTSGAVAQACKDMREGREFKCDGNLVAIHEGTPEGQTEQLLKALKDCAHAGLDPVWKCQVVVSVNEKSQLSRRRINRLLQQHLNPRSDGTARFYVDDKVVCLKNDRYPGVEEKTLTDSSGAKYTKRENHYVANGDQGRVLAVHERFMVVEVIGSGVKVRVPFAQDESGKETGDAASWDLAYAVSCWKAQGSEWPVVIAMIDEYLGARRMTTREYWYTAISRARERCYLIGRLSTVREGCRRVNLDHRKTMLADILRQQPEPAEA